MNRKNQIRVCDFTKLELQTLLNNANFTEDEERLFLLRSKDFTLERIAEEMNISTRTAVRLNRKIKTKIDRVCEEMCP